MPIQCPHCHSQVESGKFCPVCGGSLQQSSPVTSSGAGGSAPPPTDPLIGQTLGGKFKITRLLGEGGMGCVYMGEQQLGPKTRHVAVKTLHPHLSKDPKILARFEREVGTIAELEHPNTIQVYDFGKTEAGILYIVMEFVQGKNLAETLEKEGAMEPARVEKILTQVCGSLEEAHNRGIVHRDLKPDNIVLTERAGQKDFVKVLDFGIAKRSNEEDKNEQKLTQQGMVLGTPPYMSPEQFTGKPIDARSDIYSLGVMAYEMLTANLPFQANTAWEWATQHMTAQPRDIDSMPQHERIPPRMKDALRKALAKTPEERFPNVRAFLDAFVSGAGMPQQVAPAPLAGGKGRTEVGTPLDFGAGGPPPQYGSNPGPMSPYGSNPGPMAPYGSNPGPMQPYQGQAAPAGTPAFGNVAFPTPHGGVPQPPPNARAQAHQGGGNRGLLLGIAGVVALGSIVAVVLGTRKSPATPDFSMLDAGGGTSTAVLNLIDAGAVTPAPVDSSPLAALDPAKPAPPTGHPGAHHDGGAKEPPGKEPPGTIVPPGTPGTPPHPSATPPPPPPAGKVPFQCEQASLMRKAGNIAGYQAMKKVCEAAGGTVPN